MGMGHATYGAAGIGAGPSSVLEDQLLGTHGGRLQNSSARPGPYGGGYGGGGGGGYDDLPFGRGSAAYGEFGGYDGMDRFDGAGRGMSNGGTAPDRASTTRAHSYPLRPISFTETHSMASIVLTAATQRCDWKWCRWGTRWSPLGYGRLLGRWWAPWIVLLLPRCERCEPCSRRGCDCFSDC